MSPRVIITGVDGFIGRNLKITLENSGSKVFGISRKQAQITDLEQLLSLERPADVMIHLAFPVDPKIRADEPTESIRVAASGTINAIMLARACQVGHFILASSGKIYGYPRELPITEEHPKSPTTFLGRLKSIQEEITEAAADKSGLLSCTIMRIFNVYGPDSPKGFLIPHLLQGLLKEQAISIGETEHLRDWLYIDDLCRAFLAIVQKPTKVPACRVFNIGSGVSSSARQIMETLEKVSRRKIETYTKDEKLRPAEAPEERADCSRIKALGWEAQVDLAAGLSKCFQALISREQQKHGFD